MRPRLGGDVPHAAARRDVQAASSCVRLVRRENIPTLRASDWSIMRIFLLIISRGFTFRQ
eukprot:1188784-Prorocentrum_minimum.AAC.3